MEEINLKDLFNYLLSKIYILVISTIIILGVGNVYLFILQTPMFKSTSTILLVSESTQGLTQSDVSLNTNLVSTYSEIIKSDTILNTVIKNLKLDYSNAELSSKITVASVTNTQIINISVSDEDPYNAKKIVDEVASVFSKKISSYYNIQNVNIWAKGEIVDVPYNVNPVKQNAIYLLVGLVLGFGIVFVMFYFDTSIKDTSIVEEKLGLTVLGVVPKVGEK